MKTVVDADDEYHNNDNDDDDEAAGAHDDDKSSFLLPGYGSATTRAEYPLTADRNRRKRRRQDILPKVDEGSMEESSRYSMSSQYSMTPATTINSSTCLALHSFDSPIVSIG
jgi:hypothetical protein